MCNWGLDTTQSWVTWLVLSDLACLAWSCSEGIFHWYSSHIKANDGHLRPWCSPPKKPHNFNFNLTLTLTSGVPYVATTKNHFNFNFQVKVKLKLKFLFFLLGPGILANGYIEGLRLDVIFSNFGFKAFVTRFSTCQWGRIQVHAKAGFNGISSCMIQYQALLESSLDVNCSSCPSECHIRTEKQQ